MAALGTGRVHVVCLNGADPVLKWEAVRDGVILYQGDDQVYDSVFLLTSKEYSETARFRRYQAEYLSERLEGASRE